MPQKSRIHLERSNLICFTENFGSLWHTKHRQGTGRGHSNSLSGSDNIRFATCSTISLLFHSQLFWAVCYTLLPASWTVILAWSTELYFSDFTYVREGCRFRSTEWMTRRLPLPHGILKCKKYIIVSHYIKWPHISILVY